MSLASIRIAARFLAVAALAALTAGCFQPMYAEHTDGTPALRDKLRGVDLPPLNYPNASHEARLGVEIRNALAFKLYGNATGTSPTRAADIHAIWRWCKAARNFVGTSPSRVKQTSGSGVELTMRQPEALSQYRSTSPMRV